MSIFSLSIGIFWGIFVLLSSNPQRVGIPFSKTPLPFLFFPLDIYGKKEKLKQFFMFSKAHSLKLYPFQALRSK
jgi:hypothetical protein